MSKLDLSKLNLDELLAVASAFAHMIILKEKQSLMPTWILINKKGETTVVTTPWSDEREKDLARKFISGQIKERKTIVYSIVVESWVAMAPEGWEPGMELPEEQQARNQVNRKEAVIAIASNGKEKKWREWLIKRDWNEQPINLELQQKLEKPEGWMADLL